MPLSKLRVIRFFCLLLVAPAILASGGGSTPVFAQEAAAAPRLVLQITVDQLRGDLPTRYFDRLGQGGLRYLWEEGTVYTDAHHSHANTETIVGHTTLAPEPTRRPTG